MLSGARPDKDEGSMRLSIAMVPAFPKFVILCCDLVNELRKAKGTITFVNSSAAFRSEIPGTRLQRAVQEFQIDGTSSYGTSGAVVERLAPTFRSSRSAVLSSMFKHMLVWGLLLAAAEPAFAQSSAAVGSAPLKMVVLGDSLSAGLGLSGADAFPAKLQKALKAKGIEVDMTNAGVSGDTSSGGRDRLDWSVPEGTQAVIVELGANDALRGIDPAVTRTALTDIVTRLKARGIAVMLCGMLAPPNYGADFAARFNSIYPDLAKSFGVPLYPFFLEGVAADAKLNQADGLHPTAEGIDILVKNILPSVEAFLGSISRRAS
jgi:acyl-CoA thioesterase I